MESYLEKSLCPFCLCCLLQEQVRRWKEREMTVEMEERQNRNQRTHNAQDGKVNLHLYSASS